MAKENWAQKARLMGEEWHRRTDRPFGLPRYNNEAVSSQTLHDFLVPYIILPMVMRKGLEDAKLPFEFHEYGQLRADARFAQIVPKVSENDGLMRFGYSWTLCVDEYETIDTLRLFPVQDGETHYAGILLSWQQAKKDIQFSSPIIDKFMWMERKLVESTEQVIRDYFANRK